MGEAAAKLKPFETRELSQYVGTEVKADRATLLSGAYREELRELLEQRGVLVFRDLHVTEEEQLAFASSMGEVLRQGKKDQDVFSITLDERLQPHAFDYMRANTSWHFDGSNEVYPNRGAVLSPVKLADNGNTHFANTYASYADLPEAEKQAIAKLKVRHSNEALHRTAHPNPSDAQIKLWRESEERIHPLVWTHKSGRKSLVLGYSAMFVVDMDPEASRALLERLQAWATQPKYIYTHEWRMGDVLVWDNTGVIHRVDPYDRNSGRHLRRCSLAGEEPFA